MPNDDAVNNNLQVMDDLDFVGWNNADWAGVFAHHHTDDVVVDWQGQPTTFPEYLPCSSEIPHDTSWAPALPMPVRPTVPAMYWGM
jgi:hypothetical protein